MPSLAVFAVAAMGTDLFQGAGIAAITAVLLVTGLFVLAFVQLFRRREGAQPTAASGMKSLTTKANVLLVRADEAVAAGENELGFAIAQFGEEPTAEFAVAVSIARAKLQAAFRLRQRLDDAEPESVQKAREWTLQIIALCESALTATGSQDRNFSTKRSDEVDAPQRLATLRDTIAATSERLAPARRTIDTLTATYDAALLAPLETVVADATRLLDAASADADSAESGISPAGVNAVTDRLRSAEDAVRRATLLLDAVDVRARELDAASAALEAMIVSARADIAEAKVRRDGAPDPDSGAAIIAAIAGVEMALATATASRSGAGATAGATGTGTTGTGTAHPQRGLDALGAAIASLDTALAGARNQKERLEHARAALGGTLLSARSQLAEVRAFIAVGGSRVGAGSRTRLAEADRQLMLAEAEADPVEALDAARRAVTHARDADALARYDAMGGR